MPVYQSLNTPVASYIGIGQHVRKGDLRYLGCRVDYLGNDIVKITRNHKHASEIKASVIFFEQLHRNIAVGKM